jgi:hypothetical protein
MIIKNVNPYSTEPNIEYNNNLVHFLLCQKAIILVQYLKVNGK